MKDLFNRDITYLRLSVTDMCNLRCRYCMPERGVVKKDHSRMLRQEETLLAVKACAELGVTKVRVTGGEPLVKKNIVELCERVRNTDGIKELCITTNGTLLKNKVSELKNAGVSVVNISLDTLDSKKYEHITRLGSLSDALDGLESAIKAEFERVKINTVLIGGFNDDEIVPLAGLSVKYDVDVRFIELMPMRKDSEFGKDSFASASKVLEALPELAEKKPLGEAASGVAREFKLPNAKGCVGLISPLSRQFCDRCNRIRITADGKVKPCLHSADEFNIKGLDYEDMKRVIARAILAKPQCHAALGWNNVSGAGRTMNRIGG